MDGDPTQVGEPEPQHPVRRPRAAGRVVATFLRGRPTVLDGKTA